MESREPKKIGSYRDLLVWQKAMDLVVMSYRLSKQLPANENFGLISQIQRATVIFLIIGLAVIAPLLCAQKAGQAELHQRKIIFDSMRDGNLEIYIMNPDGSEQKRLTYSGGKEKHSRVPHWSPNRKKIAFSSNRKDNWEIYVMDADGSNIKQLTHTPGEGKSSSNLDWSPDGKSIAFDSDREGIWEIYMMNSDGTKLKRIFTPGEGKGGGTPEWSPDGKKIVFASDRDKSSKNWKEADIYVMNVDGSNVQRLTQGQEGESSWTPVWSPDGKRILFCSNRDETGYEFYVMDADGSNIKRLSHDKNDDYRPYWSPDGKKIVFQSAHNPKLKDGSEHEIYVMDADGSNVKRLTTNKSLDGHPNW